MTRDVKLFSGSPSPRSGATLPDKDDLMTAALSASNDDEGARAEDVPVASCGCGVSGASHEGGRKAVAVDADVKARNGKRLRRIEGQVRGIQKMVEEDRYCADILTQISSVHEALRAVGRELMRNHLKHCATTALRGTAEESEAMYDELVDLMYKHSR
jgi:CsoR family transcriptional regulator, copper-sensing transcriptional repressor